MCSFIQQNAIFKIVLGTFTEINKSNHQLKNFRFDCFNRCFVLTRFLNVNGEHFKHHWTDYGEDVLVQFEFSSLNDESEIGKRWALSTSTKILFEAVLALQHVTREADASSSNLKYKLMAKVIELLTRRSSTFALLTLILHSDKLLRYL